MTDRMTNIQIEDVLSSIRRLVSDEHRIAQPAQAPAPAAGLEPVPRLVLTPAFRVPADARPPSAATGPAASEPESSAAQSTGDVPDAVSASAIAVVAPARRDPDEESADPPLEVRIAELEALLAAEPQHGFEPDEGEAFDMAAPMPWDVSEDDDEGVQPPRKPRVHRTESAEDVPEARFFDDTTEAVELVQADGPAPDFSTEPDPGAAPATLAWTLRAPLMPEPEDDDKLDPAEAEAEALRELVREVLREELQGEIGARVTRNLRKLVRAELARALAARGIV